MNGSKRAACVSALLAASVAIAFTVSACDYEPVSTCDCGILPLSDGGFSGAEIGCGDFRVARQSADSLSILLVHSTPAHMTHERDTTYDVRFGDSSSVLAVVHRYATPQHLYDHVCNDVPSDVEPITVDTVTSGWMRVHAYGFSQESIFLIFQVDVQFSDLKTKEGPLLDSTGLDSVTVGWLPG